MEREAVRWNIKVSKKTDITVRTFLGAQGARQGNLSHFIEESVQWRLFDRKIQDIKHRNAAKDPDELQRTIDEAVREVRAERAAKKEAAQILMRVVLDTNILISALMVQAGNPAAIYQAWKEGRFTLLTCAEHLDELRATLRKPSI